MKSIRIGAGLGFYGDNWEPVAASIERGGVQFIASDHLAELTRFDRALARGRVGRRPACDRRRKREAALRIGELSQTEPD